MLINIPKGYTLVHIGLGLVYIGKPRSIYNPEVYWCALDTHWCCLIGKSMSTYNPDVFECGFSGYRSIGKTMSKCNLCVIPYGFDRDWFRLIGKPRSKYNPLSLVHSCPT
jgi:hypothetical protein